MNVRYLILGTFLTAVSIGILAGCGNKAQSTDEVKNRGGQVIPVEVITARHEDMTLTKTYTGALEGSEQADIVAKISERVVAIDVNVGKAVSKNQVVIVLDKGGPASQYLQAEANFMNADKNLVRMKALYKEGAISQQTLDGIQTSCDIAKANFDAAKQSIELASPISGVVTAVKVHVGDLVTPGSVLATIARVDKMKIIFNMNESDVVDLKTGQTVLINSENRTEVPVEGKVTEYFKSADPQSRSFEVRAMFPNTADRWFKPGMFVKVKYQSNPQTKVLVIPNQAILSDGITNRVFVVRNGKSFQKVILTGNSDGIKTVIREGLIENDTVVTVGWNNLRDSSRVAIISTSK